MGLIKGSMLGGSVASGVGAYDVTNSGVLVSEDNTYLSRTPTVTGNRRTFTFSTWLKRTNLGEYQYLFACSTFQTCSIEFKNTSELQIIDGPSQIITLQTKAVFRDVSNWYHIVLVYDLDNATVVNRQEIYVNGVKQTLIGSFFAQNSDSNYNRYANIHVIGGRPNSTTSIVYNMDSYIAETYFIDGQALTPDYFAETDPVTGQWNPKQYTGTYGTNGFYLDYKNGANLGEDKSGNSNNWTNNNVTPSIDTPVNNFATLSPLDMLGTEAVGVLGDGNRSQINLAPTRHFTYSTFQSNNIDSYWEVLVTNMGINDSQSIGVYGDASATTYIAWLWSIPGNRLYINGSLSGINMPQIISGDLLGVAYNPSNSTVSLYCNGTLVTTTSLIIEQNAKPQFVNSYTIGGWTYTVNFGQDSSFAGHKITQGNTDANGRGDFYYAPPAGNLALCSKNLPEPIITDSTKYFKALTYNDGAGAKLLGFQPDLVWLKSRSSAFNYKLIDSVRGATKSIESNTTAAEATETTGLTSFDTNGFTVGVDTDYSDTTGLGMIAWAWKKGVIPGFDIVTFIGTGVQRTVSHNLGVIPELILTFNLDSATYHNIVYHKDVGVNWELRLNENIPKTNFGNYTALPTSTEFTVSSNDTVNGLGQRILSYVFAPIEGFSKFGSYIGNGNANDGPFIYTGFRPACVIIRRIDATGNWIILDNVRDEYNPTDNLFYAEENYAEYIDYGYRQDFISNGFKIRNNNGSFNNLDNIYIYMAFAESPFKYSRAK